MIKWQLCYVSSS